MPDVDYDAPRTGRDPGEPEESLDLLTERHARRVEFAEADADAPDPLRLAEYDIPEDVDELAPPVVPMQADEFRCGGCFLVLHHRMKAGSRHGKPVCRDCA